MGPPGSGYTVPMKRTVLILLSICLLLVLTPGKALPAAATERGVLRLHILANSDNRLDQAVKLRVRDALVPLFEAAASYEDARTFVLDHGAELLTTCQTTLAAAGAPYGAQLLLGESDFPDRVYRGVPFPAGTYDALQIVLGAGAGHNWWCVLFPPLCVVTRDGAAPDPDEGITFESDILAFLRRFFGGRT